MTDEDTGSTGKTTKRKTAATKPRTPAKPRSKAATAKTGATKRSTAKATPAKTAAATASTPAKAEAKPAPTPKAEAPKAEAPKAAPAAAAPAPAKPAEPAKPAAAASSATAAPKPQTSKPAASTGSGGSSSGGGSSGGSSGGGSSGGGAGYTPPPARSDEPGLFTLPVILSVAAIVIAILIPTLGGQPSAPPAPKVDLSALEAKQAELTATIADLQASLDGLTAQQAEMETSIAAVKVPAIMISAADLHEAISSGEPFAEPLSLFQAIVGGSNEAVASVFALEPLAETGVPTTKQLQAAFGDVSHEVIAAFQTVESEGDLARRVSETMANLTAATTRLRWRFDGTVPPEGNSPLAVMARAESAAEAGDFDLVIAEIEALPDDLKAMTTGWVEQVAAQKQASQAIEDLDVFMIETVSAARQ